MGLCGSEIQCRLTVTLETGSENEYYSVYRHIMNKYV